MNWLAISDNLLPNLHSRRQAEGLRRRSSDATEWVHRSETNCGKEQAIKILATCLIAGSVLAVPLPEWGDADAVNCCPLVPGPM
jgi:hypothetical protein